MKQTDTEKSFAIQWKTSTRVLGSIKTKRIKGIIVHQLTSNDEKNHTYVAEFCDKLYVTNDTKKWLTAYIFDSFNDAIATIIHNLNRPS